MRTEPIPSNDECFVILATTTLDQALRRLGLTALWSDSAAPVTPDATPNDGTQGSRG